MPALTTYLLVKGQTAAKTGRHSTGVLSYVVLKDADSREVFLRLTGNSGGGNSGGGNFSRELIPLTAVERCLDGLTADKSIPAKSFKAAFVSRSANNPGFLVAILRAEGLLVPAPEAPHQHRLGGNWNLWREAVLSAPGQPYELPAAEPPSQAAATITHAEETAGPDSGKGRKPRKVPKGERQSPSGEEGEHASNL